MNNGALALNLTHYYNHLMKKILSAIALIASFASFAQNESTFTFNTSLFINDATLTNSQILDNNEMVIGGYDVDAVAFSIETFDVLANTWTSHLMFNVPETPTRILAESVADTAYFVFNSTSGLVWAFAYHDQTVDTLMNGFDIGNFYGNPMDFAVSGSLQRLFFVFDGGPIDSQVYYYEYGSQNSIGLGVVGAANNLQNTSIFHKEGTPFVYVVGTDQNQADGLEISQGGAADATVSMITQGPITNFITTTQAHTTSNIILSQAENDLPDVFYKEVGTEEMHSVYNSNSQTTLLGIDQGGPYDVAGDGDDFNQYILLSQSGDTYVVFKPHGTDEWDTLAKNTNYIIDSGYDAEQTALDISPINARVFGSFGNNSGPFTKVFLTNSPPSTQLVSTKDVCANTFSTIMDTIEIFDMDMDAVAIIDYTSSDPSVIQNAGGAITFTPISTSGNYSYFKAEASVDNAGSTDIQFRYTDGMDTLSHTVTINVLAPVQVSWNNPSNDLCLIGNEFDLNTIVDLTAIEYFELSESIIIQNGIVDGNSLVPGTAYNIAVTAEDMNGCASSTSQNFTFNLPPVVTFSITDANCGVANGEVTASVSSSNGPVSTTWNNGQTTPTITSLEPGGYYINALDALGCEVTEMASVVANDITITEVLTDPTCYNGDDGSIDLTISGSDGPYQVLWSTGSASQDATGASAGIYQAVITSASGCEVTKNYVLSNPIEPSMDVIYGNPTCGNADGSLTISNILGLTAPYSYLWSDNTTNQNLVNAAEGLYNLTITDDNNCELSQDILLASLNSPGVFGNVTKPDCGMSNGAIDVSFFIPAGETLDAISWSHGPTTQNVSGLSEAIYTCTATTVNGCVGVNSWTVEANPPAENPICIVTVDSLTTSNLVVWEKAQTSNVDYYNIYRETAVTGTYAKIDTVNYNNVSVFNDVVASPKTKSWRYKISAVNGCGVEGPISQAHKTVHLVTYFDGTLNAQIVVWDDYEGINYSDVDLYRYSNENGWEFISNFANNVYLYEDMSVAGLTGLDYMIEVTPSSVCTATTGKAQDYNSSRSNKAEGKFNPGFGTGDSNNSLAESNQNFGVQAYPNPNLGLFTLDFENYGAINSAEMKIIDIQGRVITKEVLSIGSNQIDISNLSNGIYTVIIFDGEFSESLKVIKR